MIYQLMRLDYSWNAIPYLIIFGIFFSLFPLEHSEAAVVLVVATVFLCRINERATAFYISLPITAREIFAARMLSILAALWAPAIVASGILAFRGAEGWATAAALLGMSSLATLMVIIVQSRRIQEMEIPVPRTVLWVAMCLLLIFSWQWREERFPMTPVFVGCLLVSAVLLVRTWERIPKSFQIATPLDASPKPAAARHKVGGDRAGMLASRSRAWRLIFRSVYSWPYLIWLPILFFSLYMGNTFSVVFVAMVWAADSNTIRWLSPLPVSRSMLLSLFALPVFLSLAAGYSVGVHQAYDFGERIYIVPTQSWPLSAERTNVKMLNIMPPVEFWKPVHGGQAPVLQAPWGEGFQPPISIVQGVRIYNPYAVGPENSPRFFDWQFARATFAVYGRSIPRSEYQFPASSPPVIPPLRIQMLHIAVIIGFALIGLLYIQLNNWRQFRRIPDPFRTTLWGLVLIALFSTGFIAGFLMPQFMTNVQKYCDFLLLRISWTLPDNLLFVIAAAALPLAMLYWIVDKLFRESELVDKPQQATA